MAKRTFETQSFEQCCGLNWLTVDGVMYQAQDNSENRASFGSERNHQDKSNYPQIRMYYLMGLLTYLMLNNKT